MVFARQLSELYQDHAIARGREKGQTSDTGWLPQYHMGQKYGRAVNYCRAICAPCPLTWC